MNLANIRLRSEIVKHIRAWFDERDFLEVQTARLVGLPGQEPYLEPFWTTVETPTDIDGGKQRVGSSILSSPMFYLLNFNKI
jgi:elongation factor P--beta-lysine ligase